jgi:hypothetical protein
MGAPSVPYGLSPEGFEVLSDENGFRATGSFILKWQDAFAFHDEIMGLASAGRWVFPGSATSRLYADSARIVPIAFDAAGNAKPITAALGLIPGEFWDWCRCDVTFKTPTMANSSADDAGGSTHFDSSNPIYGWEQTVRVGTRAEQVDTSKLNFDSDLQKNPKEATVYKGEHHLTLHNPFVPAVYWQKYEAFENTVNLNAIYGCAVGTLRFVGADIQPAQGPNGYPGRSITIDLAKSKVDWNKLPHPDTGVPTLASYGGDTSKRLYEYKNFAPLTTLP